jgi:hypothetical protein
LVVVWRFYIETRHTPLEEIAKHFDGDDALVGGAAASARATELGHGSELKHRLVKNETEVTTKEEQDPEPDKKAQ